MLKGTSSDKWSIPYHMLCLSLTIDNKNSIYDTESDTPERFYVGYDYIYKQYLNIYELYVKKKCHLYMTNKLIFIN